MTAPDLSLVIPAYGAASFIGARLDALTKYLRTQDFSWEVIVVDDASPDDTGAAVEAAQLQGVSLLRHERNRGKCGALKTGMAAARGAVRIFTDADLPYELEALPYLRRLVADGDFHLAIGDRTLPGSVYGEELPFVRRVATRIFTLCIRLLVTGGLHDTQCGLKAFRGDVADALFPRLQEEGFAGDVEMLYVALKYNLAIRRVPVRLRHQGPSTVSPGRDGWRMLRGLLRLRGRWRRGVYEDDTLHALSRQDYWS